MKFAAAILFLAVCTWRTSAAVTNDAPVKLAIIAESPDAAAAADMLTVEFSRNGRVQLLERAEIDRVYREQGMSAANQNYLKLGQILGADGLLLLNVTSAPPPPATGGMLPVPPKNLAARLVAVRPGVVLTDGSIQWPVKDPAEWSDSLAAHLNLLLPKLAVLMKDAIPVSVVNLRSAIPSDAAKETERQVKSLTIQRLSREPQFFVLERQRMELLGAEKELKADETAFWNGSYLLEGVIDQNGYAKDILTIDARLTPPQGGQPLLFEVSGSRTNLAGVVNGLAIKVGELLKVNAVMKEWHAADEAAQYFKEAQWALRWGLYPEAQMAAESAWALGIRTKELAILRTRAYTDGVAMIDQWSGNIEISAAPDAEKIPAIIRAMDLFCQDAPLVFTNATVSDEDYLLTGIHIFRDAGSLLDGFYQAAELRTGNEDQLAELRLLARRTWSILETNVPLLPEQISPGGTPKGQPISNALRHEREMYDLVKWEEGGVFFERPEDAIPMFRQMFEAGYLPIELPRFIGWNWNDRKRVPLVTRQFIANLSTSTNPSVRLGGLCLSLIQTPFYPETNFRIHEQELLTAIWDNRDWAFSRADHAAIIGVAETILRDKYGQPDSNRFFGPEPFSSSRQNLRKAYVTTQTNFDWHVAQALFPLSFPTISPGEARELVPLIENSAHVNDDMLSRSEIFRRIAGLPPRNARPAPKLVMAAEEPMVVNFVSWNGEAFIPNSDGQPQVQAMIVRSNQLWMQIKYLKPPNQFTDFNSPTVYAMVDLQTGRSETIHYPQEMGVPDPSFEVTQDSLYVSAQNQLQRYRFRDRNWQSIPIPMSGGAGITAFDGRLYLSTADSLLEVAPDTGTIQILASSRRQPAVNDLDTSLNNAAHELFQAGGQLGLAVGNQINMFEPTNRTWRRLSDSSFKTRTTKKHYSDQGALLYGWEPYADERLMGLWLNAAVPELLLERRGNNAATNQALDQLLGPPRWNWPEPFRLDFPCLIAEGQKLWMLHARKVLMHFFFSIEPVAFQDDRQATLLCFEPGTRQALMVPVRFEKNGQPTDPFDQKELAFSPLSMPVPFWISSPDGFIVSSQNLMGHWIISRAELEKRIKPLRLAARNSDASPVHVEGKSEGLRP